METFSVTTAGENNSYSKPEFLLLAFLTENVYPILESRLRRD
jgi:hypothetical protein